MTCYEPKQREDVQRSVFRDDTQQCPLLITTLGSHAASSTFLFRLFRISFDLFKLHAMHAAVSRFNTGFRVAQVKCTGLLLVRTNHVDS